MNVGVDSPLDRRASSGTNLCPGNRVRYRCINASVCDPTGSNPAPTTTLQWRMAYHHAEPGSTVTLQVIASDAGDFDHAEVLWQISTDQDIPYDLWSVALPNGISSSSTLRIAFVVDTEDGTTARLDSWEIDDVVVACGKPNHNKAGRVYRCPESSTACTVGNATFVSETPAPDAVGSVTMNACDHLLLVLCQEDPDATSSGWQYGGFPRPFVDAPPLDPAPYISPSGVTGQSNGCETNPSAVQSVCKTPALTQPGFFYCALEVKPDCDQQTEGSHAIGLVVQDGSEAYPLQSLTRLSLTVESPVQ